MREVNLTQGKITLVDEIDFDRVAASSWCAAFEKKSGRWVAKRAGIKGGTEYLHRFILDAPISMHVDHMDGNTLNNQRSNLRICTQRQNKQSRRTARQFKGAGLHKLTGKFAAYLGHSGKRHHLGLFPTIEAAARAYDQKARELFGEFAALNFPTEGEVSCHLS